MTTDNKTLADVQPGGRVRLGDAPWPEIDAILADSYSAGAEGLPFEGIARRAAVRKAVAALSAQPSQGGQAAHCPVKHCGMTYARVPADGRCHACGATVQPSPGGQDAPERCAECRHTTFEVHPDGHICVHCKLIVAARQPVVEPVAYLDLGAGGYMDVGTDLSDEALAELPKGRHMLGIIGTYGVGGYKPAQAVDPGAVRALLRRRIEQWRSHLPADPGAPGTREIETKGEHDYNNDVRIYREGIAVMEDVLALIDSQAVGNK